MIPHERSLVQRYQQRPFALLGVNTDPSPEALRKFEEKERLNWRSWWDGPGGPISTQWKVQGFPTLFLIDHRGVVRYEWLGAPRDAELDRHIEDLVREAEGAPTS
jgi:peroxiredoxin